MDRKTQKPCERANSDCMRPLDLQMKLGLNDPLETRTQFNYFSQANANNSFRTRKKKCFIQPQQQQHDNDVTVTVCVLARARACPPRTLPYTYKANEQSFDE